MHVYFNQFPNASTTSSIHVTAQKSRKRNRASQRWALVIANQEKEDYVYCFNILTKQGLKLFNVTEYSKAMSMEKENARVLGIDKILFHIWCMMSSYIIYGYFIYGEDNIQYNQNI